MVVGRRAILRGRTRGRRAPPGEAPSGIIDGRPTRTQTGSGVAAAATVGGATMGTRTRGIGDATDEDLGHEPKCVLNHVVRPIV